MKTSMGIALLCVPLTGCSLLGYHKVQKAVWAPPEEAAAVVFPNSFKEGVHLEGPMMTALEVAMNEFLPPGSELQTRESDKRMAQCLSKRSSYNTHVLQSGDDLFFVWFSPNPSRCGLNEPILDGGAVYAIDGQGRILDRR
ncbi:hypothetical protein JYK02_17240 [Corallococcus macrosporus]|uniref:Lipoprotein n=1 Tax=Corallococcus macrosporus TaxID=35 RepID=A0ABS3DEM0_9BACT|nr:hypothetical protein [Corallococcus macrosporus]MBN8229256.1 hypothetical protein [Corallococcus macrosporus]